MAPPPGSPRFALFDSLRGIAVLFILPFHVTAVTGAINDRTFGDLIIVMGNQAVLMFFTISGFLLYRPYVSARAKGRPLPNARRYARRRVLRIVPAYWLALTLLAIWPGIVGVFSDDWWRYYGFNQLYSHDTIGKGIPPAWSLSVEVTYYLALPFFALAVRRLRLGGGPRAWLRSELVALGLVYAVGVTFQVLAARQVISDLMGQSLLGQSTWLALGMTLAVASVAVERSPRPPRLVRMVIEHPGPFWVGGVASLIGLTFLLRPGGLFGLIEQLRTVQPFPTIAGSILLTSTLLILFLLPAVFGERAGGVPRRVLAWGPLAWIGLVSYGVYLWQLPVAHVLGYTSDPGRFSATGLGLADKIGFATTPILFALTLAVTCAVAAASYYLVELRFLRLKER